MYRSSGTSEDFFGLGRRIVQVWKIIFQGREPRQDLRQGRGSLDGLQNQAMGVLVDNHFVSGELEFPRDSYSLIPPVAKQACVAGVYRPV